MGWFGKSDDKDDLKKRSRKTKEEEESEEEEEGNEEESNEDEEENSETYTYSTSCDNCGENVEFEIPVGTRIVDYENSDKCENCGCKLIDPEARGQSQDEEK